LKVTKDENVAEAFAEVKKKFGCLSTLVNCAGISFAFKIFSTRQNEMGSLDRIQRTMDVCFFCIFD
jgi:NAD(P)-dependent dehydrogenase (short-subunit alcohol dehydrogenase family)